MFKHTAENQMSLPKTVERGFFSRLTALFYLCALIAAYLTALYYGYGMFWYMAAALTAVGVCDFAALCGMVWRASFTQTLADHAVTFGMTSSITIERAADFRIYIW